MKSSVFKKAYIFAGIGIICLIVWSIFATFYRYQKIIQKEGQKIIYFLKLSEENLSLKEIQNILQKREEILEIKILSPDEKKEILKKYQRSKLERGVILKRKKGIEIYYFSQGNIWKIWLLSKELDKEIRFLFLRNIIALGGGMIFIFSFFKLLFEKIINPLKELKKGIDEVKKGNLNVKLPSQGSPEMKEIIESFNEMLQKIKHQNETLKETSTILKIRINAKTRALNELSLRLKKEVEEKTKTLKEKIEELEKIQKIMIGREYKIAQLKKEIERLKEKLKQKK